MLPSYQGILLRTIPCFRLIILIRSLQASLYPAEPFLARIIELKVSLRDIILSIYNSQTRETYQRLPASSTLQICNKNPTMARCFRSIVGILFVSAAVVWYNGSRYRTEARRRLDCKWQEWKHTMACTSDAPRPTGAVAGLPKPKSQGKTKPWKSHTMRTPFFDIAHVKVPKNASNASSTAGPFISCGVKRVGVLMVGTSAPVSFHVHAVSHL